MNRCRVAMLGSALALVVTAGCVPDHVAKNNRTWTIANECSFEVAVRLGVPAVEGDSMNSPNQFVLPGDSVGLTGQRYLEAQPQVWAWRQSSSDRPIGAVEPIFKVVVGGDGEDLTLEGVTCEFMNSD